MTDWLDAELSGCEFKDKRLGDRFKKIAKALASGSGKSIPQVCEEWAMTKSAYRFLSNDRVEESEILAGHFQQTGERIEKCEGPVLVLHDTTEFTYHREDPEDIGYTRKLPASKRVKAAFGDNHKACGILMHASLAVTPEGLPLGLTSVRFWSRQVFKGTNQLKRKVNPTRIPIEEKESIKWIRNLQESTLGMPSDPSMLIHVGDRENDIYEYFCECKQLGCYFLIRSCVNRLADDTTIAEELATQESYFKHSITAVDAAGQMQVADLKVKTKNIELHPPADKQAKYSSIKVAIVSATEIEKPANRERIRWTLITNLPVKKQQDALKVLDWYKQRWKIEQYFKILKSGFKAEESKLRTAERLSRLISIFCILAWRIQWITMLNRESSQLSPKIAFDDVDIKLLTLSWRGPEPPATLSDYIIQLARMGGYLARKSDPPPGNTIIWRGLNRLHELRAGYELAIIVGN